MMKLRNNYLGLFFIIVTLLILSNSCKKDDNNQPIGETVKDIEGNVYTTITIGSQVWMVENLKTTKFRNGDPIPNVSDNSDWRNQTSGAYCNYNNDVVTGNKYGRLYNWYAVNDSRNIAPLGWHVSTNSEWSTLKKYVAANIGTSGSEAKALASKTDWSSDKFVGTIGNDLSKNNFSGFTAQPGGRRYLLGEFDDINKEGRWWSSNESNPPFASDWGLASSDNYLYWSNDEKMAGNSVRCVKN